jgi:hypothetical protein
MERGAHGGVAVAGFAVAVGAVALEELSALAGIGDRGAAIGWLLNA